MGGRLIVMNSVVVRAQVERQDFARSDCEQARVGGFEQYGSAIELVVQVKRRGTFNVEESVHRYPEPTAAVSRVTKGHEVRRSATISA